MKSKITAEQIVETTLDLINEKGGSRDVNLRKIARILKCHHTNIYNYFDGFDALLWASMDEALSRMLNYVTYELDKISGKSERIERLFTQFIRFYLENKGWFRLIWFDQMRGKRPEKNLSAMIRVVNVLTDVIWDLYKKQIGRNEAHYIIHTVHCFLHGEVAIFISGRGIFKDENLFIKYVAVECEKIIELLIRSLQEKGLQNIYPKKYKP